jgi:hypothetical protein
MARSGIASLNGALPSAASEDHRRIDDGELHRPSATS